MLISIAAAMRGAIVKRVTLCLAAALLVVGLGIGRARNALAQNAEALPDYVPVLPKVAAHALAVDPHKGYRVKELKPGVYLITEGAYGTVPMIPG
jgi:hypothetical protein